MESENNNQAVEQANQATISNRLHQVTPLSKYLAMALFIVLPFFGAWIGYEFAPEKVVETIVHIPQGASRATSSSSTKPSSEYSINEHPDAWLRFLYQSNQTDISYYSLGNNSGRPVRILGYNPAIQSYFDTKIFIDIFSGETSSPTGRYVSKLHDNFSPTASLHIIDLETESTIESVDIHDDIQSLMEKCGQFLPSFKHEWTASSTLRYEVYDSNASTTEQCYGDLSQPKELRL